MADPWDVRELSLDMDAAYRWSVGLYMERFIRGLGERKLWGIRCPGCGRVSVPPRKVCERCFTETDEWVEVGPRGTVRSFTVGHVGLGEAGGFVDIDPPEIVALVQLDGADCSFVHVVREADPGRVAVGLRVEPVFSDQPSEELSDLAHFRPIAGEVAP